ncbi:MULTISPECIES: SDR family NAD(P)-dependent oxidoreductase [Cyanophyceae]|uniref:SDR family oxidoreductase n=1 Tax=Leptolyngbya subtilissima DQ-A4 TaxID=2933933 RepID=A0ABV0K4S2_9CYAN|nr:SDR family oxidoreductase [Nodosilinea sp. FACHB-141]MBD2112669.1 SDR family oxidoreductase [Nodosilinea sp. FACHB-141]
MTTALITGASAGIGAAFAQQLAAHQTDLVLVARSQDKLQELANSLRHQHQIQVDIIVQDLTAPNATETIFQTVQQLGRSIDLLVNNAGVGDYGDFTESNRDLQLKMVQLNIATIVDLSHRFLPGMRQRRTGGIINMSSVAAFQSMPYFSIYAATKAFTLSFSEALWAENRSYGVHVLAVCPGPAGIKFFKEAGFPSSLINVAEKIDTPVKTVVQDALEAFEKREPIVIPGSLINPILATLPRFVPREWVSSFWKLILGHDFDK